MPDDKLKLTRDEVLLAERIAYFLLPAMVEGAKRAAAKAPTRDDAAAKFVREYSDVLRAREFADLRASSAADQRERALADLRRVRGPADVQRARGVLPNSARPKTRAELDSQLLGLANAFVAAHAPKG